MTTTLLQLVQVNAAEIGFPQPTSLVGSTETQAIQWLRTVERSCHALIDDFMWPELSMRYYITLISGQASYPMPSDIDSQTFETHWNQNRKWPLYGPLTAAEWEWRKNSVGGDFPYQRYRVMGWKTNQLYIDPTPGADDAGQVLVFEYQSKTFIHPPAWQYDYVYVPHSYVYEASTGIVLYSDGGGKSGDFFPAWAVSSLDNIATYPLVSVSGVDGTVQWQNSGPLGDNPIVYDMFHDDDDVFILDDELIGLDCQWRFLRLRGLPYSDKKAECEEHKRVIMAKIKGAKVLSVNRPRMYPYIGPWSVPDTGFGT